MPTLRRAAAVLLLPLALATPAAAKQKGVTAPHTTGVAAETDIRNADGAVVGTLHAGCSYTLSADGTSPGGTFQVFASVTSATLPTPYLSVRCTVDGSWSFGPVAEHDTLVEDTRQSPGSRPTPRLCVTATAYHYGTPTTASGCTGGTGFHGDGLSVEAQHGLFAVADDAPRVVGTCTASPDQCDRAAVGLAGDLVTGATGGGQAEATVADNTVVVPLP